MSHITDILNMFVYKGPKNRERFELLEDEREELKEGASEKQTPDKYSQQKPPEKQEQKTSGQDEKKQKSGEDSSGEQSPAENPGKKKTDEDSAGGKPVKDQDKSAKKPPQKEQGENKQKAAEKPAEKEQKPDEKPAEKDTPDDTSSEKKRPSDEQSGLEQSPYEQPDEDEQRAAEKQAKVRRASALRPAEDQRPKFKKPMTIEKWKALKKARRWQAQKAQDNAAGAQENAADAQDNTASAQDNAAGAQSQNTESVTKSLGENLRKMKEDFNFPINKDIVVREFKVLQQSNAFIIYIDGMVDKCTINDYILRQLMEKHSNSEGPKDNVTDYVVNNLLAANQIIMETEYNKIIDQVLNGLTALFIEGSSECILIESRGFEKRQVTQPLVESVIRGSQEAFVENLRTNITLIRRAIRSKDLVTEMIPVGKVNNTNCAIMYIKGITNPKIVAEVKKRITSIDIDLISSYGVLEQLIEDHPFAILPQILSTERPDRTASFLMDGKVAIICEGTPFASIVPITVYHMFHTSEDYSLRWQYGAFLRIVRMIATLVAVFLPGIYIALTLFHQEMIPTELLMSLAKAGEKIPFPAVIEILVMEISLELIREAGIRMPGIIGPTLGIIGAVILGQAAVSAGLVSPVLIIIVAITGLGSFAIPNFSMALGARIIRFVFIFAGAVAGFYGIAAGVFILTGIMCSMKSFGVPYVSPVAPKTKPSGDVIVKMPAWMQTERPDFLNPKRRSRTEGEIRGWIHRDSKENGQ